MSFNILTTCTGCNTEKICNKEIIEINGLNHSLNYCENCYDCLIQIENELLDDFYDA